MFFFDSESDSDNEIQKNKKVFKQRINFEIEPHLFVEKFRVPIEVVDYLTESLSHRLRSPTNKSKALSVRQKLLIALHWFGTGCQYHVIGDAHGVNKMTVCRCIKEITSAINEVEFQKQVCWPESVHLTIQGFFEKGGMPEVCGAIDGILINIDAPSNNESVFVDRHGNHSLNCMAVCGPDLRFFYVSANWPGSVHDARVLRNSTLFQKMENGWRPFPNSVILGDSAYPLKTWLMPPSTSSANTVSVIRYNRAHKKTRRLIECAFGVLKEKFPCLNHLRVEPVFAANIFKCCVALCNMCHSCTTYTYTSEEENAQQEEETSDEVEFLFQSPSQDAQIRQQQLLNFFQNNQ